MGHQVNLLCQMTTDILRLLPLILQRLQVLIRRQRNSLNRFYGKMHINHKRKHYLTKQFNHQTLPPKIHLSMCRTQQLIKMIRKLMSKEILGKANISITLYKNYIKSINMPTNESISLLISLINYSNKHNSHK